MTAPRTLVLASLLCTATGLVAQTKPVADPGPTYRLTYTITDFEQGKRVGVQHFAMTMNPGNRDGHGSLKIGDKIPIVTGSSGSKAAGTEETQFTYLDVGLNLSMDLRQVEQGILLTSRVEQSSELPGANPAPAFAGEPIIRQTVLSNTAILPIGKTVTLGSLDVPGSLHHRDFDVVLELVQ